MKTSDFFNLFKSHQLGKKRNFGSYRVIDGDNCQILVRSSTRNSVPNGSELLAITFSPQITLWHHDNLRQVKYSVVNDIAGVQLRINETILDENDDSLIESGIIDIDKANDKMLIEIGDTPWLFEHEDVQTDANWSWTYNIGTKLGVRCTSIIDALKSIVPEPNTITALGWTLQRCADDFVPDGISAEDRMVLAKPISPMDYGFQIEQCKRETTYTRGSLGGSLLFLKTHYLDSTDGVRYVDACNVWDHALTRYDDTNPERYENISTNGGEMLLIGGAEGTLYLKGENRIMYDTEGTVDLDWWHKLLNKSNKIRLKG